MGFPIWAYFVIATQVAFFIVLVAVVGLSWWIAAVIAAAMLAFDFLVLQQVTSR